MNIPKTQIVIEFPGTEKWMKLQRYLNKHNIKYRIEPVAKEKK